MKHVIIFLLVLFLGISYAQQNTQRLGNQNFIKDDNNNWLLEDTKSGMTFKVNTRSITVKLKDNISKGYLVELNKELGTKIEIENKLGYIDLKLPDNSDFIEIYKTL